jgi:hypothetical protein
MIKFVPQILMVLVPLLVTGCQTVSVSSTPVERTAGVSLPANRPATDEESVASDPCAIRLDHVIEAMYQFYLLNKRLPDTLEQLKPFGDELNPIQLVCTATGQPYQYSFNALMSPGRSKRILVWDPTPAHQGRRYCILISYTQPNNGLALEVDAVPEADFKTYVPGIQ